MKILKKLPKWAIIAMALVLVAFIASTLVHHFVVKDRVGDQKERIQQRQQLIQEEQRELPSIPDIWGD